MYAIIAGHVRYGPKCDVVQSLLYAYFVIYNLLQTHYTDSPAALRSCYIMVPYIHVGLYGHTMYIRNNNNNNKRQCLWCCHRDL